jgi:hypothetical protein
MLSLRVRVRGRHPLTLALPQEDYVIAAGASWRRASPRKSAESYFHGTGLDDRFDHLRWLWIRDPVRRLWIDIEVVDASVAVPPRRQPRRAIHWKEFFEKLRAKDLKRAKELDVRLREARSGIYYQEPRWAAHPPALGFRVTLNRRELNRLGVSDPGALSIDVVLRHRFNKQSAHLSVNGGDRVGQSSWRPRTWPCDGRRLTIGDRLRIEVVAPVRLSRGRGQGIETTEVSDVASITRELKELNKRLTSGYYRRSTADMLRVERERPPARRYPRHLIREP